MSLPPVYLGRDDAPPGLARVASGKVRDIYALDAAHLLFVTTDRVSAFDVVMREGIPCKGQVLTAISAHWFESTRDILANHLVSTSVEDVPGLDARWKDKLRGRVMIVTRARPTSVEWVVRGYIAGSGWKDYQKSGAICGVKLPAGLQLASRLPEPILTPTTKEEHHDLPLTNDEARARVGGSVYQRASDAALALFRRGTRELDKAGILLADTKFEFGVAQRAAEQGSAEQGGDLILIDEALTPDSSRFWPKDTWKPGTNPASYDKQILRDWLETLDWNKEPPAPTLDPDVVVRLAERYLEICARITGRALVGAGA